MPSIATRRSIPRGSFCQSPTNSPSLAGLGSFTAHGAGFLTAARELGVEPDLVTATSGQIIVLGEWLRSTDLKAFLTNHSGRRPLGTLLTAYVGIPDLLNSAPFGVVFNAYDPNQETGMMISNAAPAALGHSPPFNARPNSGS